MLQLSRRLSHALSNGHPLHTRLLLRFLTSLSSHGTLSSRVVLDQLTVIVDAAEEGLKSSVTENQKRGVFYVHSVLAALPWWANGTLAGTIASSHAPASSSSSSSESAAASYLLGQGANDPFVAQHASKMFRRCEQMVLQAAAAGEGSGAGGTGSCHPSLLQPGGDALSARRQQQLNQWIDLPPATTTTSGRDDSASAATATTDAMRTILTNASQPDTVKLCKALRSAMITGSGDDDGEDHEWRPEQLAVPTIARPQDDPALARLLLERPKRLLSAAQQRAAAASGEGDKQRMDEDNSNAASAAAVEKPAEGGAATGTEAAADDADSSSPSSPFAPLESSGYLLVIRRSSSTASSAAGGDDDEKEEDNGAFIVSAPPALVSEGDDGAAAQDAASRQLATLTSTGPSTVSPLAPPSNSFTTIPSGTAYHVKAGLQLFGPGGGLSSTPAVMGALQLSSLNALSLWCLRDVCSDLVVSYHPFQQETAQALLHLPFGPSIGGRLHPYQRDHQQPFGLVVVALEAILSQMLEPQGSPFPEPYYSLVIINILAQEAAATPSSDLGTRALGMAARVLWKFLYSLDDSLLPRIAVWVSHHVSCTRWEWIWEEWATSLTADEDGSSSGASSSSAAAGGGGPSGAPKEAQKRLMHSLLQRTFALVGPWHYERVVKERFPSSLVEGGFIPPPQGQAASSIFFPEITIADENAAKSLSASGAEGGGSSTSLMDSAGSSSSASSSADSATAEQQAADTLAVESFLRKTSKESPGLYGGHLLDASSIQGCRSYAAAVMAQMRARLDASQMKQWLTTGSDDEGGGGLDAAKLAGLQDASANTTRFLVFCHSLLLYAKANMRNTRIILERYKQILVEPEEAGFGSMAGSAGADVILDAVSQVWSKHRYLGNTTITDLVELEIVTIGQVVRHALKLSAFDLEKATSAASPASSYPSAVASSGVSLTASSALTLFTDRSLLLDVWELIERLLLHSRDNAHRARAELSLFLGAKPYDLKDEELDEDVAAGKEAALRHTARKLYYRTYLEDGLRATLGACSDLCRLLQKHLEVSVAAAGGGSSAAGSSGALGPQQTKAVREALRVALAHMRSIVRAHLTGPTSEIRKAPQPSEDGVFDKESYLASLDALVKKGYEKMDLDPDLAGLVLETGLGYLSTSLSVPEALLRDADVPAPSNAL
jgi:MIF4G like